MFSKDEHIPDSAPSINENPLPLQDSPNVFVVSFPSNILSIISVLFPPLEGVSGNDTRNFFHRRKVLGSGREYAS